MCPFLHSAHGRTSSSLPSGGARLRRPTMSATQHQNAIVDLAENRVVDGVYAVIRKEKLRTRGGASYLALELADSTGRISGRVWNDVELLDARFAEGDAVHVLGRVEKFRDRLQLEVRALEPAETDPASLAPSLRRDADELEGFVEFLSSVHHDLRAARTAEAAALYHANQLDAVAATRPVPAG